MSNSEQTGFIPRSIVRTFQRFVKQVGFKTDLFVIYEFRISRYIAIASLQCFFFLFICPWVFQFVIKFFLLFYLHLLFEKNPENIFINYPQQERAFEKMQTFSQQVYFETLLESFHLRQQDFDSLDKSIHYLPKSDEKAIPKHPKTNLQSIYQNYFFKSAQQNLQQSFSILTNWILDLLTLLFFIFLLIFSTPQILILKTFCIESLLSLSETTKCFFLIFFLDLLVGFHSSQSWEIFLQFIIEHFGFYQNQNFIAFFISTFPVLLDTIFKYWIFRYLNKISPSTVATYQAMIE